MAGVTFVQFVVLYTNFVL